ncbi:hypothetical protein M9458_053073, partial [Cirrhinus mrigala]
VVSQAFRIPRSTIHRIIHREADEVVALSKLVLALLLSQITRHLVKLLEQLMDA